MIHIMLWLLSLRRWWRLYGRMQLAGQYPFTCHLRPSGYTKHCRVHHKKKKKGRKEAGLVTIELTR